MKDLQPQTKTKSKPKPSSEDERYVALIHFHGMGEQRRHEEVSHLIDALEQYDHKVEQLRLMEFAVGSEPPRTELGRPVTYTQAIFNKKQKVRFYEGYYADLSAGGMSPLAVLWWLLKLGWMPYRVLRTPWRGRMRLHKATLFGLQTTLKKRTVPSDDNDYRELIERYDAFEDLEARRKYPKGTFWNFLHFLKYGTPEDSKDYSRLRPLARKWGLRFVAIQLWTMFLIFSLILALLLLGVYGIPAVLQYLLDFPMPWREILLVFAASFAGLLLYGANIFLRAFLSDVFFWTTYQETSEKSQKRRAILNRCADFISHVIADKNCQRVVLVGHSLGTTVLHDTLFDLVTRGRAGMQPGLKKIQHIVTLASPVDKIHYLFESTFSDSHRFNEIIESTRGDLSKPPFSSNDGQPLIHWINFWNRADVISSRLYTPAGVFTSPNMKRILRMDNFEVALDYFPEPAGAHTQYFKNKFVLETIYNVLLKNQHNFVDLYKKAGSGQLADYSLAEIGSNGKGEVFNAIFQILVILLPWLSLLDLSVQMGLLTVSRELSLLAFQSDVAVLIAGVVLIIYSRLLKRQYPSVL